ncbi:MAG: zinc ribbon domain-containing protein [Methanobrevibacter sp.]|nr:zinc ribbon domain-containing protein [Methanobrevibacter sp.]
MALENYCRNCGNRIHINEPFCTDCGCKTGYSDDGKLLVFTPPIHDIGFFDFSIDFSPYIESNRKDFKYEICSCGYLNEVDNEYCYMCGAKRTQSRLSKILKNQSKPKYELGNTLCDCGHVNKKDNVFCEMCGKQLHYNSNKIHDNYSNFNLEFEDSIFCFCGGENEKFSQFCKNCGLPLQNYGASSDVSILCTCSTINEVTSDYCIGCGNNLKNENSVIVCVCGHKNKAGSKFCETCERPLNPKKVIKSKIICTCGEILDWDTDFCHNCGKNIRRVIVLKNSLNNSIKNIKSILR